MADKSKVLHIRIPVTVLAACVDAYEMMSKNDPQEQRMSSIVGAVLRGLTATLTSKGDIPKRLHADALARIEPWYSEPPDMHLPFTGFEEFDEEEDLPEDLDPQTIDIPPTTDPGIERPLTINPSAEPVKTKSPAEWREEYTDAARMSIEDIRRQAAEDDDVVKGTLLDSDKALAVEVVYSGLDRMKWGTPLAEKLVRRIIEQIAERGN